jgi:hypothetical protein
MIDCNDVDFFNGDWICCERNYDAMAILNTIGNCDNENTILIILKIRKETKTILVKFTVCNSCLCYTCSQSYRCPKAGYDNPCVECTGTPPYIPWDIDIDVDEDNIGDFECSECE